MKRMLLLALPALASCAPVPAPGPAYFPAATPLPTSAIRSHASVTIGFGGTAILGPVVIRPQELLEDSRCPASVQCVWAGQVRIRAEITDLAGRGFREFTLGQPVAMTGGTVTLVSVEPPKLAPGPTGPAAYRLTFRSER